MKYKVDNTYTVRKPENIFARRFCKKWRLDVEATLNGTPMEFYFTVDEYNDGSEIRIEYKHDDTYEGSDYDKFEIKREESPLTTQRVIHIFEEYIDTNYEDVTREKLTEIKTEIIDQHVSYSFEFYDTKDDYLNMYLIGVELHQDAVLEEIKVGNKSVGIRFFNENESQSTDNDRLALKLAKALFNAFLEEKPSPTLPSES